MVRFASLLYFYRKRLRVHLVQELLAGLGIATGVALVFSILIEDSGVAASSPRLLREFAGDTKLELAARAADGFDDRLLAQVEALPGVEHAGALLEQHAWIVYGGRRASIELAGLGGDFFALRGIGTRQVGRGYVVDRLMLSAAVADQLALVRGERLGGGLPSVRLLVRGRSRSIPVTSVLDSGTVGPLASTPVGIGSIRYVQQVAGLPHRATRILVVPAAGRERLARAGLERLAAGRLTVATVDDEVRSLAVATAPIGQSMHLFAIIGGLVGLLFAFTAMLLTVPERRRFVAELRMMGYTRLRLVQIVGFQAIALGLCASTVGLLAGYGLSTMAADEPLGYLQLAYPLSATTAVTWETVAIALASGVLVASLAGAQPLLDLRRRYAMNEVLGQPGEPGHAITSRMRRALGLASLLLLAAGFVAILVEPSSTTFAYLTTAFAMLLAIPAALTAVLWLSDRLAARRRVNSLTLAVRALRATSLRSLGLVATAAVAVFGAVGLEGSRDNMLNGLNAAYRDDVGTADLWISQPGDELAMLPFDGHDLARRVAAVPGVRAVRDYGGGLLDLGDRRIWLVARPRGDHPMVAPAQVVAGNVRALERRLRAGGWITVSQQIAAAEHVRPGQVLRLPTPTGVTAYRIAATTTSLGWGPGMIVMSRRDQRRAWASDDPTALEVDLDRGTDPGVVQHRIRVALGSSATGLTVETPSRRLQLADTVARQMLGRLGAISTLLLTAAALAMAAAMGTGLWQRRAALAQLRVMGWRSTKLWYALLWETTLLLGTGCLLGATAGVCGYFFSDRWLQSTTGCPTPFALAPGSMLVICLFVSLVALVITAVPGMCVSRTAARVGLDAGT